MDKYKLVSMGGKVAHIKDEKRTLQSYGVIALCGWSGNYHDVAEYDVISQSKPICKKCEKAKGVKK
jgi:hypothetical protein